MFHRHSQFCSIAIYLLMAMLGISWTAGAQTAKKITSSTNPNALSAKPTCGYDFLSEFIHHYGLIECLSRGDKLCISERVNSGATTAIASMAGATTAGVMKVANNKLLSTFVRAGASRVANKVAWAAVTGGVYFVGTKLTGAVIGFFADTGQAGDCRDSNPWVLYAKGPTGHCEMAYKITDNVIAENFFNLKNESEQLAVLKDPMACDYFQNLHRLLIAEGQTEADRQGLVNPALFDSAVAAVKVKAEIGTPRGAADKTSGIRPVKASEPVTKPKGSAR